MAAVALYAGGRIMSEVVSSDGSLVWRGKYAVKSGMCTAGLLVLGAIRRKRG